MKSTFRKTSAERHRRRQPFCSPAAPASRIRSRASAGANCKCSSPPKWRRWPKPNGLPRTDKREPLLKAARAAAAAVDAAEAEGENARLDKLLVRNAETMRARDPGRNRKSRCCAKLRPQSNSRTPSWLRRDEDEEDEMIALLMMS